MTKKSRKQTVLPKEPEGKAQQELHEPRENAEAANTQGDATENAFKQLRRAVRAKVRKQSEKIAESLVNSAMEGNSSSARIMVSLVEKKKKKDKSKLKGKRGHSLALDLASDPQLPPEDDDWAREEREAREEKPDP